MIKDDITPEEKLLKIIENPAAQKQKVPPAIQINAARIKSLLLWFKKPHIDKGVFKRFDLRMANKMVAVLCGVFTVLWIFDFVMTKIVLTNNVDNLKKGVDISNPASANIPLPDINMDDLLASLRTRNIFTFIPPKSQTTEVASDVMSLINNMKLVGIIWSDNPQAMIEDTKEQKTYLLNQGEQLGQVKIKTIYRDKVVVTKEGQDWELR